MIWIWPGWVVILGEILFTNTHLSYDAKHPSNSFEQATQTSTGLMCTPVVWRSGETIAGRQNFECHLSMKTVFPYMGSIILTMWRSWNFRVPFWYNDHLSKYRDFHFKVFHDVRETVTSLKWKFCSNAPPPTPPHVKIGGKMCHYIKQYIFLRLDTDYNYSFVNVGYHETLFSHKVHLTRRYQYPIRRPFELH